MSLGDYLRLLRAKKGGVTPWDIEAATDLPKGLYRQMEQRYRAVGDEASIRTLAEFYDVSPDDLSWRQEWSRKALSYGLVGAAQRDENITLVLWDGAAVVGRVEWWDLGAVGLRLPDGDLLVVMRHAVERWEPRAALEEGGDQDEDEEENGSE